MFFLILLTSVLAQYAWNLFQTNEASYCQLANVMESNFYFTNTLNQSIHSFITTDNTYKYGLVVSENTTSDMIYSLSCKIEYCLLPPCPRFVFLISTNNAMFPAVYMNGYKGAVGRWRIITKMMQLQVEYLQSDLQKIERKRLDNKPFRLLI